MPYDIAIRIIIGPQSRKRIPADQLAEMANMMTEDRDAAHKANLRDLVSPNAEKVRPTAEKRPLETITRAAKGKVETTKAKARPRTGRGPKTTKATVRVKGEN